MLVGFVWHDLNRNGIQDDDEPGMPDVGVFVQGVEGDIVKDARTNFAGFYEIILPVGEYATD